MNMLLVTNPYGQQLICAIQKQIVNVLHRWSRKEKNYGVVDMFYLDILKGKKPLINRNWSVLIS